MDNGRSANEGIGARVLRKEDTRFMRGRGCYVSDLSMPGLQEVAFYRSPIAHGDIRGVVKPDAAQPAERDDDAGGARLKSTESCWFAEK